MFEKLTTAEKIVRAKVKGYDQQPFFSYLLSYFKIREEEKVKTMAVDNKGNLYYNKEWVESLSEEELIGLLFHETCHIALDHLGRKGRRNARVLNVANDAIINAMLKEQGIKLPKNGIIPDYEGNFELPKIGIFCVKKDKKYKSSEELYEEIYAKLPPSMTGDGSVSGEELPEGFDEHIYGENGQDLTETEAKEAHDKWKGPIAEAAANAKQRGKLPSGMEELIEQILDTKISWFQKLYKYMVDKCKNDYTWSMPSRRSYGIGTYLPKVIGEKIKVVTSIDTSGSMDSKDLEQAMSEIYAIANSFSNIEVDIIICDAEIQGHHKITNYTADEIISMSLKGRGGTSHKPVYDYVNDKMPDTKVLINLTDGYTDFPNEKEHPFDTLWVITSNGCNPDKIPFGEVIKIEE